MITVMQITEFLILYCRNFFDSRQYYIKTNIVGIQQYEYMANAKLIKIIIAITPRHPVPIPPE